MLDTVGAGSATNCHGFESQLNLCGPPYVWMGMMVTHRERDSTFTEFVEDNSATLSRLAYLLSGNRTVAEDLLQDALLKTYLAWHRIERETALAYVRRTMVNLTTDRWRRRRYEPALGHEADLHAATSSAAGYEAVDARDHIAQVLLILSPRERAIVVLRHYLDLPEQAVAAELNVSVGTVKSTCSRALARLRPVATVQS